MTNKLNGLISRLEQQIKSEDPAISFIKYPQYLINALTELRDIVGMESIKDSIAEQVMYLIVMSYKGKANKNMLNTVLYGPPGVGKTKVGLIMAKIWYGLGFLEKETSTLNAIKSNQLDELTIFFILIIGAYIFQLIGWLYKKVGLIIAGTIILFILLIAVFVWFCYNWNMEYSIEEGLVKDREIIKVVSRPDFVAEYLGQSAPKTKRLLAANRGKVLFIDEAYSLYNGYNSMSGDMYGDEVLTAINLWMSENPDDTVIIFAGYKDLMQKGIFKVQPGLPRRCMWHFECEVYTGSQLFQIFKQQLESDGWSIKDELAVEKLITKHQYKFTSYGGDTEKLCFFVKMQHTKDEFMGNDSDQLITVEQVAHGINLLSENNILNEDDIKITEVSERNKFLQKMIEGMK